LCAIPIPPFSSGQTAVPAIPSMMPARRACKCISAWDRAPDSILTPCTPSPLLLGAPPALSSVILHACVYALVLCAPYAALSAAFCCCILRLFCTEGLCAQRHHGSARPPCGDAHAHAMSLAHLKGVPTLQPSGRCMLSSAVRSLEFSRSPTGDKVAVRCDTRTAHVTCQSARDAPCV